MAIALSFRSAPWLALRDPDRRDVLPDLKWWGRSPRSDVSSGAIGGASWQNGRASGWFPYDRAARLRQVTIK
jgi:hypothetical protein